MGTALYYTTGWNLVSFGADTVANLDLATLSGTLYTHDAFGSGYVPVDAARDAVQPGVGYWVFADQGTGVVLSPSQLQSVQVTVPSGGCALVGNPSTSASARVIGASRVFVFSPQLNTYVRQSLVDIGSGAWACNDTSEAQVVSVVAEVDAATVNWPVCCSPTPTALNGAARLVVQDDSPYPLSIGVLPVNSSGDVAVSGATVADKSGFARIEACLQCSEYSAPPGQAVCNEPGPSHSFTLPPGRYLLHAQIDGPSITDLQDTIDLQADTAYSLCFFVRTDRPRFP